MRPIILFLLIVCTAGAAPTAPDDSRSFINADALSRWAASSTYAGSSRKLFSYNGQWFYVVFRSHASGAPAIEPFVFVKSRQSGRWVRWLRVAPCRFFMDASVEGNSLILWHLDQPRGRSASRTEFLRFNLSDLDAGSPWTTGAATGP